jgi:hypothetical protein
MLEPYLEMLEEGHYEAKFAFDGLADENVWKRPSPTLLSVGEIAGHIAYWEAVRLAGEGGDPRPDVDKCRVKSPLVDVRFSYYPEQIENGPSEAHVKMTAAQVCAELVRVHTEAVADFKARNPDPESTPPGWDPFWTYRSSLKYAVFHIGYHTGQMYSVRHLLGETTPDN